MDTAVKTPSFEDTNKLDTWRQEIEKGKVENTDNPPEKVVVEHERIYNSLTEEQKQKWDQCTDQAERKYYAMMEGLGYENPRKNFTFFKPHLADDKNIPPGGRALHTFQNNQSNTRYSTSFLDMDVTEVVTAIVHENIHGNDHNINRGDLELKTGLDVKFREKVAIDNDFLTNLVDNLRNDYPIPGEKELEFINSFLTGDFKKFKSYFTWFGNNDLEGYIKAYFPYYFDDDNPLDLHDPKVKRMIISLFESLYVSPYTLDGVDFNEGVTEYFASKYTGFEDGFAYKKQVTHIKTFVDSLPNLLKKSFERALMDAKVLSPKEGGGYPVLTRWFCNNLGLRISPLIFINLSLDRDEITAKIEELNNTKGV